MGRNSTDSDQRGLIKRADKLILAVSCFALLWCANGFAQDTNQVCEDLGQYRNIRTSEPIRGDRPLRQDNISDEEVREVQRAALEVYPDSIVSISGVTDGCDCEDGVRCTAQVWLALNRGNRTRSLVLSKIDGHWKIGAVQRWWLQYNAHQASDPGFGYGAKQIAWQQENQRLLADFPTCPTEPAKWTLVRNDTRSSKCVDMSSMQVSEFIRRVNFKSIYPAPKGTGYPQVKYTVTLMAFDCKDHRQQVDQQDTYYDDGRVTKGSRRDPVLWDPVRPDTIAAADLDLVCGWTGK